MRFLAIAGVWAAAVLVAGCQSGGITSRQPVYRHHFEGLRSLAGRADQTALAAAFGAAESRRIMDQAVVKLGARLPAWLGLPEGSGDAARNQAIVRALLEAESEVEVYADGGEVTEWLMAARLDPERSGRLRADVERLFGADAGAAGSGPLEARGAGKGSAARFETVGEWSLLGRPGRSTRALVERLRGGIAPATVGGTTGAVCRVEADLARMASLLGWAPEPVGPVAQWPRVQIAVEPRKGRLRTIGRLEYGKALALELEPWVIPQSVLSEPLAGFTAMQGADTWLGRVEFFKDFGVEDWPNQLFLWSLAGRPWQQYFCGPVASPTNLIAKIAPTLPVKVLTNSQWRGLPFGLRFTNEVGRVELRGLPWFAPFLQIHQEAEHPMVYGGLFLPFPTSTPPPPELLEQVSGRTNLVFYDWEVTGRQMVLTNAANAPGPRTATNTWGRLLQYKHLATFLKVLKYPPMQLPKTPKGDVAVAGGDWIDAMIPVLGETVTEVTQTAPTELQVVRQSALGFGSLELMYLLRWLEDPGFPGWTPDPEPQPVAGKSQPAVPGKE